MQSVSLIFIFAVPVVATIYVANILFMLTDDIIKAKFLSPDLSGVIIRLTTHQSVELNMLGNLLSPMI